MVMLTVSYVYFQCSLSCGLGLQERLVECVNIEGEPSLDCRERRPASRRRCAGPCIPYSEVITGWTRIVSSLPKESDGFQVEEQILKNAVINQKEKDNYNDSHTAEFLEAKTANNARIFNSKCLFLLSFLFTV